MILERLKTAVKHRAIMVKDKRIRETIERKVVLMYINSFNKILKKS
jgi:hypothetical protein